MTDKNIGIGKETTVGRFVEQEVWKPAQKKTLTTRVFKPLVRGVINLLICIPLLFLLGLVAIGLGVIKLWEVVRDWAFGEPYYYDND